MGLRRKGREAALQILFFGEASGVSPTDALATYARELAEDTEGREFADSLIQAYASEADRVDTILRDVSQHWRLERMSRVDRNILRLGVTELLLHSDIPARVTLNECIELAKRYGTEQSAGFVNGVLDRIAADLRKE